MKAKMNIKSIMLTIAIIYLASMFFINMSFAANTGTITVEAARLRETAEEDSKNLELIPRGEKVEILSEDGIWYKVEYQRIIGYVKKDIVEVENKKENSINENKAEDNKVEENNNTIASETSANIEQSKTDEMIKGKKYVIAQNVKIKVIPLISAIELDELSQNTDIEVTEVLNGWVKVKTADEKIGWVRKEKITTKKEKTQAKSEQKTAQEQQTTRVATTQETSRSATITRNTQTEQPTQTAQVNKTNNELQVAGQPQTTTTKSAKGNEVVAYAKQFLGCKYLYGGTTTNGFDCSGFTQFVYKHFGVSLNRTAAAQYSNGTAVTSLQSGDLVMFGKSGISHVGIYIGGNRIIHAANSKRGVTTDTIASGFYKTNYVGARRIF